MVTSIIAVIYVVRQRVLFTPPALCENPHVRLEWRTLSTSQKLDYINAVKCLQSKSSDLDIGGSLYDDFPYTHRAVGYISMLK